MGALHILTALQVKNAGVGAKLSDGGGLRLRPVSWLSRATIEGQSTNWRDDDDSLGDDRLAQGAFVGRVA